VAAGAALTEVIDMKKSTLTPSELAVMVVTELRQFRFDLDDILIVQVEGEQVGTNWRVLGYDRAGRRMHPECQRRVIEVQERLRQQYDAVWPGDKRRSGFPEGCDRPREQGGEQLSP
jgi:hypothetical protein